MLDKSLISHIVWGGLDDPQRVYIVDAMYNDRPMSIPELWEVQEQAFEILIDELNKLKNHEADLQRV